MNEIQFFEQLKNERNESFTNNERTKRNEKKPNWPISTHRN